MHEIAVHVSTVSLRQRIARFLESVPIEGVNVDAFNWDHGKVS